MVQTIDHNVIMFKMPTFLRFSLCINYLPVVIDCYSQLSGSGTDSSNTHVHWNCLTWSWLLAVYILYGSAAKDVNLNILNSRT